MTGADTVTQLAEYCQENPGVLDGPASTHALVDGEVYRISTHPQHGVDVTFCTEPDVVECPGCGEITAYQHKQTPCCGEVGLGAPRPDENGGERDG
jgi:hypothetical protein